MTLYWTTNHFWEEWYISVWASHEVEVRSILDWYEQCYCRPIKWKAMEPWLIVSHRTNSGSCPVVLLPELSSHFVSLSVSAQIYDIILGSSVCLQEAGLVATERLRDVLTPEARKPPICQLPQPPSPVISSPTALGKIEQAVPCEEWLLFDHVSSVQLVGLYCVPNYHKRFI
jgi:hypothetical protein